MSDTPFDEKKLVESIEKSGFPLELFVSKTLAENGWTAHSKSFYDGTVGRREIDVVAEKIISNPNDNKKTIITLLIECKKFYSAPWVFLRNTYCQKDPHELNVLPYGSVALDNISKFYRSSHYSTSRFYTGYCVGYSRSNSSIYDAVNQIISPLGFYFNRDHITFTKNNDYTELIYPVIVFDGQLLSYDSNSSPSITEEKHVCLKIHKELDESVNIPFDSEMSIISRRKPLVIDIVKKENLVDFIKKFGR